MNNSKVFRIKSVIKIMCFCMLVTSCSVQSILLHSTDISAEATSVSTTKKTTTNPILPTVNLSTKNPTDQTVKSTITPIITVTSKPTYTKTVPLPIMENRYLLMNDSNQNLYLVDSMTGVYRNLGTEEIHPLRLISFVNNGCNLIVRLDDKSIDQIDLKANIIVKILPSNWYQGSEWVFGETMPASQKWIAYFIGYGSQGYDSWEFEDVETMRLSDRVIFRLSKRGGASVAKWSPDGSQIAFSDFDENNIRQIYVSNADGTNKKQLTYYTIEKIDIHIIKWSPDGKKLAFEKSNSSNGENSLVVVLLNNGNSQTMTYPTIPLNIRNLWWNDSDILVIHSISDVQSPDTDHGSLVWLNTQSSQIISKLNGQDTPDNYIISASYFDSSKVAYFSDSSFFTYDYQSGNIKKYFKSYFNYSDWSLAPIEFQGEKICSIH